MSGIKLSQLQELTSIDVTSNDILLLACDETGPFTSSTISLNTLYNSFGGSGGGTVNTGNFTFSGDTIGNTAGMLLDTGRGVLAIGTDMEAPGVPTHFHIAFQNSNTTLIDKQLFLGDDYNYVNVGTYNNGVNISSYDRIADLGNQKTWNFGNTGDLSLPVDGGIVFDRNNTSIRVGMGFHIASGEGISLEAIDQTDPDNLIYKGWYFNPDGSLTLPLGGDIKNSVGVSVLGGGGSVGGLDATNSLFIGGGGLSNTGWSNIGIGLEALYSNTTGDENVATGNGSLYSNTTGFQNIATGINALYSNTTGFSNTATGTAALYYNTTGFNNVATGNGSLLFNTTGNYNIATGVQSLFSNTTGDFNIGIGFQSLINNTTGSGNIASGYRSLQFNTTGSGNIASGNSALYSNTTGEDNIATGNGSLYSNTTGQNNIASGTQALYSNTTGELNIASGLESLWSNTTGNYNIASGYQALYSNIDGIDNIASGYQALWSNTTGGGNIATGGIALLSNTTGTYNIASGIQSLTENTTGNYNIGIGTSAGRDITTGSNNTIIGSLVGSSDLTDTVLIGAGEVERIKVDATGLYVNGTLFNGSNSPVPATSEGVSGDKLGMLAFDSSYIYYCTADYTDGTVDIWNRTAQTVGTW